MDLLLDENNDLVFHNGPLTKAYTTQPLVKVVAQRLLILLQTWQEEWFLDTTYGIPYWQNILGKKTSKSAVDLILQEKVLAENGVKEITYFSSTLVNRQYSAQFKVRVVTGEETDTITIIPTS